MSVDAPVKSQRSLDLAEMAKFRREWRVQFGRMDLATLIATHDWFYALVEKYPYHLDEDAEILEEFHAKIESKETALIADAQKECPIAFFKPSWEQAQILNAWSPEFEPELAPNGYRSTLLFCANRIGKDLRDGTMVATPDGYKPIENLVEGEFVLNEHGQPVRVTGVFPQGLRQMHRITFNDGTSCECSETHLWTVQEPRQRFPRAKKPMPTHSTLELREIVKLYGSNPKATVRCALPSSPAALFTGNSVPVDAYLVGLLLGDGGLTSSTASITNIEPEILDYCRKIAPHYGCEFVAAGKTITYRFAKRSKGKLNKLITALRGIGLFGVGSHDKFIPDVYKTASPEERIAVLQGLMDTDGYVNAEGSAMFYSVSKRLVDDFAEVARSLGVFCTISVKNGKYNGGNHKSWIVNLRYAPFQLFRIPRKREREVKKNQRNRPQKLFVSVEPTEVSKSTCISVDSESGLFLLKDGIVTHNTTAMVIDTLLWILPNDPNWLMFEEMEDTSPQKRGKYRVFRRPNWDYWHRTGRMIYDPTQPPKSECEIWQGVVDDDHWNSKIGKEFRKWLPPSALGTRGKDVLWMIAEKWFQTKWGTVVKAKSYNSDVLAWAGKAVWRVNLDEGLGRAVYTEALTRVLAGGYFFWAYTPAEARNLGERTKLAYDAAKLKDDVKPPGATKVFLKFAMADAPEWILPAEKKADDMRRYAAMGGQGKVRMEGGFFESSPVVFKNFKRAHHVLPWTGSEILKLYPDMCIIRGMDEGTAHPTTCVWVGILRTGEMIAFREFSESDLSVGQRCEKIIDLSGNTRIITHPHHDSSLRRYKENMIGMKVRRTFADSKIFKRDPENPADDWTDTYRKNGLLLERATNIGPAARCDYVNDLFLPDHTRKHLCSGTEHSHLYPTHGFRLYIAQDCEMLIERLENYLQEQVKSGVNVGKFTGQPGKDDDDLVDAACYALCSKVRWVDMAVIGNRGGGMAGMKEWEPDK